MTLDELETALGQQVDAIADGTPIAWPNRDYDPADGVPYIEFRHSPVSVDDPTGNGEYEYQRGLLLLTVVTERGKYSGEANGIAQALREGFRKSLRLSAGSGNVVINAPPSFGSPFVDGVYWRQPLVVSYITE
jgi:hypothetical protein